MDLDQQMLAAVIAGEGLKGISTLAAGALGAPVAILLPGLGIAAASAEQLDAGGLMRWAAEPEAGEQLPLPEGVRQVRPVLAPDGEVGKVVALVPPEDGAGAGGMSGASDSDEVLRAAALATLCELAVLEARDQVVEELRGSLVEDLRTGELERDEILRRSRRLGCDLGGGTIALAAEASGGKPRYMAAIISSVAGPVIIELAEDRIFALLGVEGSRAVGDRAREALERLRPHGPAAVSGFYAEAADAGKALEEAELMLEVLSRDPRLSEQLDDGATTGVYRLLLRALASNPIEVRRFYEDTVEVLVRYDTEHGTDLLPTLEAYLASDCNLRATGEAIYAHRQTVAHRLERIAELCGLDPGSAEHRERLGLGIKTYRLIESTLPPATAEGGAAEGGAR